MNLSYLILDLSFGRHIEVSEVEKLKEYKTLIEMRKFTYYNILKWKLQEDRGITTMKNIFYSNLCFAHHG